MVPDLTPEADRQMAPLHVNSDDAEEVAAPARQAEHRRRTLRGLFAGALVRCPHDQHPALAKGILVENPRPALQIWFSRS